MLPFSCQESLSELVPSQWGLVHLFDLCLRFGHVDTAWALASCGVTGCRLEDHHLKELPDASDGGLISLPPSCLCNGTKTCSRCCWGFPADKGIWMKDWDIHPHCTAGAAMKAAKMPLVRYILELSSSNETLPLAMSDAAAARLLDIAILCGNVEAAAKLAKNCKARPLRRWRGVNLIGRLPTFSAALLAGADFQDLCEDWRGEAVPLLQAAALLFDLEQWQQLERFYPQEKNRWPTCDVQIGELFLSRKRREDGELHVCVVSIQRIQNALRAGWDLKHIWAGAKEDHRGGASLLDWAILFGQADCAEALGFAGVALRVDCLDLHRRAFRGERLEEEVRLGYFGGSRRLPQGSALECQSAASAAAHAFLTKSFQREGVEKGIAVYQTLTKKFHPRGVPMALVRHILAFSMEAPKILDQLDLWDKVRDWMPSLKIQAEEGDKHSKVEDLDFDEKEGLETAHEPSTPSAELRSDPREADAKTTDDLMTALQLSRDQVPVLNIDGVCVFRLTRMASSDHVTRVLLDATGPLRQLHRRVLEAGCEVNPEWSPVKALLVPITESQMAELQALAEHGYELTKRDHILALQTDQDLITKALSQICRKNRPKLKKAGPEIPEAAMPADAPVEQQDDSDEDEPLLVLESGLRTDSDVGYPSYPTSSTA
eukprot:s45_g30.t1